MSHGGIVRGAGELQSHPLTGTQQPETGPDERVGGKGQLATVVEQDRTVTGGGVEAGDRGLHDLTLTGAGGGHRSEQVCGDPGGVRADAEAEGFLEIGRCVHVAPQAFQPLVGDLDAPRGEMLGARAGPEPGQEGRQVR